MDSFSWLNNFCSFSELKLIVVSSLEYCFWGKVVPRRLLFQKTLAKNSFGILAVSLSFVDNVPSGTFSLLTFLSVLVFECTYFQNCLLSLLNLLANPFS